MERFLFSFWWLIFPLSWFAFGFFGMWLRHRRHRDAMEVLKTYAAQGKEPPAEVSRILSGAADTSCGPNGYGYGYGWWGRRYGPYWEWRRVFIFTSLAVGFGIAAYYGDDWGVHAFPAFGVVAAVMGCLAFGSLIFALLARRIGGDGK